MPLLDPQAGKPDVGFRTITTVGELWYYSSIIYSTRPPCPPNSLAPRRAAALSPGRFPTAGCLWEEKALLWPAVRSPGGAMLTKATAPQPAPLAAASLCSTLGRGETPRGPCSALEAPGWSLGSAGWGRWGGDRSSLSLPPRPHRPAPDQGQHLLRCRHMRILCWTAAGVIMGTQALIFFKLHPH